MKSKFSTLKFYSASALPRLFLALFLGLGLQLPLHAATKRTFVCLVKLRAAVSEASMPAKDRRRILNRNVKDQNILGAEMKLAWTRVSTRVSVEGGLREDEHFFWFREGGLRAINKTTSGIAFTEKYLLLKDRHLSDILREKGWGELIHRNFKDRVIVSNMDPKQLGPLLAAELTKRILVDFQDWGKPEVEFLMEHTDLGISKSFEGAHLKASGFDISKWHKQAVDLRKELEKIFTRAKLNSTEVLTEVFRAKKNAENFGLREAKKALRSQGLSAQEAEAMSHDVLEYLDLLQGADMLPPPDLLSPEQVITLEKWIHSGRSANKEVLAIIKGRPWNQRHALFLRDSFNGNATHIFALDIKGFSENSFQIRDIWIQGDNNRQDLRTIYKESTQYLEGYFEDLIIKLKAMKIKTLASYRSGDDALFSFGPEITAEQYTQISALFKKQSNLYSYGVSKANSNESLGMLIELARAGIGHEKDKLKEQNLDH